MIKGTFLAKIAKYFLILYIYYVYIYFLLPFPKNTPPSLPQSFRLAYHLHLPSLFALPTASFSRIFKKITFSSRKICKYHFFFVTLQAECYACAQNTNNLKSKPTYFGYEKNHFELHGAIGSHEHGGTDRSDAARKQRKRLSAKCNHSCTIERPTCTECVQLGGLQAQFLILGRFAGTVQHRDG